MPLDPKCQMLIEMLSGPPISSFPVNVARGEMNQLLLSNQFGEQVTRLEDRVIPGPRGDIPVRIYAGGSGGGGPLPVLVYFHGGGWVLGNLDTHDGICRALTNLAGCLTVAVDYRLAPEHKFPAPFDDCYAAVQWIVANAASLGGDPARVAVGGDSAGGNLAAAVALAARARGGPALAHQLLMYPSTDAGCDTASCHENAEGYLLTLDDLRWYWGHYLASAADAADPLASPLRAPDLAGLPPATVITAEYDPLRDEGEAYGAKLRCAGVPVRAHRYDGVVHGFMSMAGVLDQGKEALEYAAESLRAAFAR